MASKEVVAGVGARYGVMFLLDSNGLPAQTTSSATAETGTQIEGLKSLSVNTPEPQRVTHYGDDSAFAQDSLPPTEIESYSIVTSKTNLTLDAAAEGGKVYAIGNAQMRLGDSDNRGNEPLVMTLYYRQALDVKKSSTTFGKLRQWNVRVFPSQRISPQADSYEQGATDKTYNATPTKVTATPWGETFTTTSWGATRGAHIEMVMDYQPRVAIWKGNGTLTSWNLPFAPVDSSNLWVWVGGSLTVPGSITYGATPAITIPGTVGNGTQIFAIVGVASPS